MDPSSNLSGFNHLTLVGWKPHSVSTSKSPSDITSANSLLSPSKTIKVDLNPIYISAAEAFKHMQTFNHPLKKWSESTRGKKSDASLLIKPTNLSKNQLRSEERVKWLMQLDIPFKDPKILKELLEITKKLKEIVKDKKIETSVSFKATVNAHECFLDFVGKNEVILSFPPPPPKKDLTKPKVKPIITMFQTGSAKEIKRVWTLTGKPAMLVYADTELDNPAKEIQAQREAKYLEEFRYHPRVAKAYKCLINNHSQRLVMKHYPKDLHSLMDINPTFTEDLKVQLGLDILQIFNHLHDQEIVYRDGKLENILTTNKLRAKLIDFGLTGPHADLVREDIVGTLTYASPECLLKNIPSIDLYKNDVWAVGCSLWCLFVGVPEWMYLLSDDQAISKKETIQKVLTEIKNFQIDESKQQVDGLALVEMFDCEKSGKQEAENAKSPSDSDFEKIIRQMLRFDPKERITMEQALEQFSELAKKRKLQVEIKP